MKNTLQALRLLFGLTLLTGFLYPVLVYAIAQIGFPEQANGSLVRAGDRIIGSSLIAQKFESPRYFWPRPSAADFATVASGASNKGPTSEDLRKSSASRSKYFGANAPGDLLTASGSGLDPHLSPAAAYHQAARVAEARGLSVEKVTQLIDHLTEEPQLGFLGEPRINVLALNLELDVVH